MHRTHFWRLAAILTLTAAAFFPSLYNDFTNWDDPFFILNNPHTLDISWNGIRNIFLNPTYDLYIPLTTLLFALERHYAGLGVDPLIFHATSYVLHLLNVTLAFVFLNRLSKNAWATFLGTVLFAVSPLRVESVAWASEQKDLLYAFFFLSALIVYHSYLYRTAQKKIFYIGALVLFILSCLAKNQAIVFPGILVLLDYHRHGRLRMRDVLEKIPFAAVSLGFIAFALHFVTDVGTLSTTGIFTFFEKVFLSGFAAILYILKLLLPSNLSPLYPFPYNLTGYFPPFVYIATALLAAIVLACLKIRNFFPYQFFLGWFGIHITLALMTIWFGGYFIMDHYTYLASLGLYAAFGFFVAPLFKSGHRAVREWTVALVSIYVFFFSLTTFSYCMVWRNSGTLWTHTLELYPDSPNAYLNRAAFYQSIGQMDKALGDINGFIKLMPDRAIGYTARAGLYAGIGNHIQAVADYSQAIQFDSNDPELYNSRAREYLALGKNAEAEKDLAKASALLEQTNLK